MNTQKRKIDVFYCSTIWQQRLDEECNQLREQMAKLQREHDEQSLLLSDRLDRAEKQSSEYLEVFI